MRINCAHDGPEEWLPHGRASCRLAEKETGKSCKIAFDLPVQNCEPVRFLQVPESSAGSRCETNSGKLSHPAYRCLLHANPITSDGEMIAIPVKGSIFSARPSTEMSLNSPIPAGANALCKSWTSTRSCCVCTNDRTGYVIQGTKLRLLTGKRDSVRRRGRHSSGSRTFPFAQCR